MVKVNPNENILLLDASYVIFYRYFAVYNWYKMAEKTVIDVETVLSNKQFMDKYDKLFEETLEKLRKKHQVPYDNVIYAKDCMRDNIWRYKHFTAYKRSRDEKLKTFNGDIFKHCYNTLLPKLEEKLGIQSCEHPCAEADDVIAVFTRQIHLQHPNANIIIVTNDNDYLQLVRDNVLLVNLKNLDLSSRLTTTPEMYLKMKIIMGDKSDNIPSVFPKCGDKRALVLAQYINLLEEKLASSDVYRERFALNTLLIDTLQIPKDIQDEIRGLLVC
jgi:5'-3' exonuclease